MVDVMEEAARICEDFARTTGSTDYERAALHCAGLIRRAAATSTGTPLRDDDVRRATVEQCAAVVDNWGACLCNDGPALAAEIRSLLKKPENT